MGWITDIWNKVKDLINEIGTELSDLVDRIDAISFDSTSALFTWFGTVKYLIGDTAYVTLMTLVYIGIGFTIYKIIQVVVSIIKQLIPRLRGWLFIK